MTSAGPYLFGAAASAVTLAGGWLVLRAGHRLGLLLGLSAGVVLGVAVLDLLPEALRLAGGGASRRLVAGAAIAGFATLWGLRAGLARLPLGARLGSHVAPASLTLHSLVDGCGIGLAFQLSPQLGWGVALAMLSHDLADGANVAGLSLAAHGREAARRWLLLNGIAPFAGVVAGQAMAIPPLLLVVLLAALAGAFLHIGLSELVPRSVRLNRGHAAAASAAAGFGLVWLGTQLHA